MNRSTFDSTVPVALTRRKIALDDAFFDSTPIDWQQEEPERARVAVSPGRRARLQRYVQVTMGACVVICAIAVGRRAMATFDHAEPAIAMTPPLVQTRAAPEPTASPETPPPMTTPTAIAVAPAGSAPAKLPPLPSKGAKHAKQSAQHALEAGRVTAAIEAGTRAVTLDPSDADAWLVLGAAYQEKGQRLEARRAFQSCRTYATRGSRSECSALLR